jgi:hypothetical protein
MRNPFLENGRNLDLDVGTPELMLPEEMNRGRKLIEIVGISIRFGYGGLE